MAGYVSWFVIFRRYRTLRNPTFWGNPKTQKTKATTVTLGRRNWPLQNGREKGIQYEVARLPLTSFQIFSNAPQKAIILRTVKLYVAL